MKCLSVKQPWASLIDSGRKTIELRKRPWSYRGPLIICASGKPRLNTAYEIGPLGVSICLVELVDVRAPQFGDEQLACHSTDGYLCWCLRLIRTLPHVSISGQLSPWSPATDLLNRLGLAA